MTRSPVRFIFHLLPNAHLDPVWLWDWREGLNEGLTTVRTILDLMDEFPQLTFIRGESFIYEHIENTDPATFERIAAMVEAGRWDIVGGTCNQPDTNLAATETLCRQYEKGLAYFESRFRFRPRVAWQADSFGHSPGLPNILSSFGMTGFAFTRPARGEFPMAEPAFWWEGDAGNRILCYRQHYVAYCSERDNLPRILDQTLAEASAHKYLHVGVLMGLGNHGGGPSRRHIEEARLWAYEHPEVDLRFSTLHQLFDCLESETKTFPVHRGDLGFCLRGCYSSVMKLKSAYRRSEVQVSAAETTQTIVTAALQKPAELRLEEAWDGVMFNSFHDILPGSSIERALDDQLALTGLCLHHAQKAQFQAMNQLARKVDTSVAAAPAPDRPTDVPLLVWNSQSRPFRGWIELEAGLDYRPIFEKPAGIGSMPVSLLEPGGEPAEFQEIEVENRSMRDATWRKRLLVRTEIPALGWKVFRLGYRDEATPVMNNSFKVEKGDASSICNGLLKVGVTTDRQISIQSGDVNFFNRPGTLGLRTYEDIWGSWGGMREEVDSFDLQNVLQEWKIVESTVLEEGPERAALWTRWEAGNSWMDLTFYLLRNTPQIRVKARLLWNERSSRLKLILPQTGLLHLQVAGSVAERNQPGTLPCGRWIRRGAGENSIGFVSDVISDVDADATEMRVTLARASRYADDVPTKATDCKWLPAVDCGELKYEFWLATGTADLEQLTEDLLQPPVAMPTAPHTGTLPDAGSFAELKPEHLKLLAAVRESDHRIRVRVQNCSSQKTDSEFIFGGQSYYCGELQPYEIRTVTVQLRAVENSAESAPAVIQERLLVTAL